MEGQQAIAQDTSDQAFFWNLYARSYDKISSLMPYRKLFWDAYQELDLEDGMKLLDAGCGTGNFALFVSKKNRPCFQIEATDLSSIMVSSAKKKCTDLDWVNFTHPNLDRKLAYPNDFFDRVLCTNEPVLIGGKRAPRFMLQELIRVLKPGGKIVLVTPKVDINSLGLMLRNHFRRIKHIWGLRRKFKAFAEGLIVLLSIQYTRLRVRMHTPSSNSQDDQSSMLFSGRLVSMFKNNNMRQCAAYLTNAGQTWITSAHKNSTGNSEVTGERSSSNMRGTTNTIINKKRFADQKIGIREATAEDVSDIRSVEISAWGVEEAATKDQLKSRIEMFPAGNIVAERGNEIMGYVSFMLIDYEPFSLNGDNTWYKVTDNGYTTKHDFDGSDLFGVNLSVAKGAPPRTSKPLIFEVIKRGMQMGVRSYVLGSRIPLYHKHNDRMSAVDYVRKRSRIGKPIDPELRFYVDIGMKISDVVPNYYKDPQSLDYGVIMRKDNPFHARPVLSPIAKAIAYIPYDFAKIVERVRK